MLVPSKNARHECSGFQLRGKYSFSRYPKSLRENFNYYSISVSEIFLSSIMIQKEEIFFSLSIVILYPFYPPSQL